MADPALPIPVADFDEIRRQIDVSLSAKVLPDAVIGMSTFAGKAADWVEATDPDWATRTGLAARSIRRAAIYYCAALILPRLPQLTAERMGEYSYNREVRDINEAVANLVTLANEEMNTATGSTSSFEPPTFFTAVPAQRTR